MIKFEHTLFALPFAYLGLFLAEGGLPKPGIFLWVTVAMAGMRTAGMIFNRIADRKVDALNPRTKDRALPRGLISLHFSAAAFFAALLIYFFSAYKLNRFCFTLSPVPLALSLIYPYLKKVTWLSHFTLGAILGMAPAGGWAASRASVSPECFFLWAAVLCWAAGFDMIYALQDVSFDRAYGLYSFPAVFGEKRSLQVVRLLHAMTVLMMAGLGIKMRLGGIYWTGLGLALLLLLREQWVILRKGLEGIQEAFFFMNAMVSFTFFLAAAMDLLIR